MTITRIISIGVVTMFALAIGIATFDPTYAENPCCSVRNGVWIVNKTGKPATATQLRTMGGGGGSAGASMGHRDK